MVRRQTRGNAEKFCIPDEMGVCRVARTPAGTPPSYRKHSSGQACVTVRDSSGRRREILLGPWDSRESKTKYARILAEHATGQGHVSSRGGNSRNSNEPKVNTIVLAYYKHAESYYRAPQDGSSLELHNIKTALRPVRKLYGRTPAREFGPLALRAVRESMIRSGLAYTTINARINRIRRVFRWAGSVELIPGTVNHNLQTVEPLQRGRSKARDPEEIKPVPIEHVEKTFPFMPRPVAAMARLQLLCGCRAGEVMAMRGRDLVVGSPNWEYRPAHHKNDWRGHDRVIPLGPKAQAIVKEFLTPDLDAYLFSPRDAVQQHHGGRGRTRKSKKTPSEREKQDMTRAGGSKHACRYDRRSYRQAIVRACEKAFPHATLSPLKTDGLDSQQQDQLRKLRSALRRKDLAPARREELKGGIDRLLRRALTPEQRGELKAWRRQHRWSPLQLRHTAATLIRMRYGLEASQVVLGHAKADTTQIYAERDLTKAHEVMAEIG